MIVFDPKFFAMPYVDGSGTPVSVILDAFARGMSLADITGGTLRLLGLTVAGIESALDYAADTLHAQHGPRRIHGWGKVSSSVDSSHHGIVAFNASGSVLTACAGRWSASSEAWTYAPGVKADIKPKCGACERVAIEQLMKETQ